MYLKTTGRQVRIYIYIGSFWHHTKEPIHDVFDNSAVVIKKKIIFRAGLIKRMDPEPDPSMNLDFRLEPGPYRYTMNFGTVEEANFGHISQKNAN